MAGCRKTSSGWARPTAFVTSRSAERRSCRQRGAAGLSRPPLENLKRPVSVPLAEWLAHHTSTFIETSNYGQQPHLEQNHERSQGESRRCHRRIEGHRGGYRQKPERSRRVRGG